MQRYDEAFERIKELTNEQELDRLVSKFIEKEDANFALFNYVNEQNNRIEDLQEMIQHVSRTWLLYCYCTSIVQYSLASERLPNSYSY